MSLEGKIALDAALAKLKDCLAGEPEQSLLHDIGGKDWKESWDRRIRIMQEMPFLLPRHRNATIGINRFPAELLIDIFKRLQPELVAFNQLPDAPNLTSGNEWIRVTHVCYRWRTVALDDKSLWRRIRIGGQHLKIASEVAIESFGRSSPLQIEVAHQHPEVYTFSPKLREFYGLVQQFPHRLGALHLRGHISGDHPAFGLSGIPIPNMITLELYPSETIETHRLSRFVAEFAKMAPNLRKLSFRPFDIPESFPRLPITHLYLFDLDIISLETHDAFLSFLEACSSTLHFLCLVGTGSYFEDIRDGWMASLSRRLHFPSLSQLDFRLGEYSDQTLPFSATQNLSIPPEAVLTWDQDIFNLADDLTPESAALMSKGLVPLPGHIVRLKKIVWTNQSCRHALFHGYTLWVDVGAFRHVPHIITLFSPTITSMAFPVYDWSNWPAYDLHESFHSITTIHICWHNTLLLWLMSLEQKTVRLGTDFVSTFSPFIEVDRNDEQALARLTPMPDEDDDEDYPPEIIFPRLETLVVYIGDDIIDPESVERYCISRMLRLFDLAPLQMDEDLGMTRHRPSSASYRLSFAQGGEERFAAL